MGRNNYHLRMKVAGLMRNVMGRKAKQSALAWLLLLGAALRLEAQLACDEKVAPNIRIDTGHSWHPPFGLDRVGKPVTAIVDLTAAGRPLRQYYLAGFRNASELERHVLNLSQGKNSSGKDSFKAAVSFASYPDQVVLLAKCRYQGETTELMRYPVKLPDLEADAIAKPERVINPVDLGTILPPADWLLLAAGQKAIVEVAAISYHHAMPDCHVKVWFESSKKTTERNLKLETYARISTRLELGPVASNRNRTFCM
jgi:hypothetical protein